MGSTLLPAIPAKRYFTIGEVGELCEVKPHVLRYWEQEFTQLRPMKRRGNRRYYQHHEVLMIRRIRDLLYEQGFTISGARNKLQELMQAERGARSALAGAGTALAPAGVSDSGEGSDVGAPDGSEAFVDVAPARIMVTTPLSMSSIRKELLAIRLLLAEPLTF
ncbi:MerR family transcriptional regulator [Xylophilus sp. GOD-11R]|uniref:MerR family transcriptional regulator n=1 Tax=Xylophilus sp. GOD-11R TaxID=3089814 RepID=UPI00298CBB56|nr:MerR family transcriptional regulator [Xylophilus sp. GOD-11R]WPB54982.1 MerR family transcriptional regulator [Xylophilus sp. GOD-11R]